MKIEEGESQNSMFVLGLALFLFVYLATKVSALSSYINELKIWEIQRMEKRGRFTLKKMKWIYMCLAIMIVGASIVTYPADAYACSCVSERTVQENRELSDSVFEGVAITVKDSSSSMLQSSTDPIKASFQVNKVWKGQVTPRIEVITVAGSASCGFNFKEGERYLVFAEKTAKSLEVNLCNGTVLHSAAGDQLSALGGGSIPPQQDGLDQQSSGQIAKYAIGVLLLAFIFVILFILYRKRQSVRSRTSQR